MMDEERAHAPKSDESADADRETAGFRGVNGNTDPSHPADGALEIDLDELRAQFTRGDIQLDRYLQKLLEIQTNSLPPPDEVTDLPGSPPDTLPQKLADYGSAQGQSPGIKDDPMTYREPVPVSAVRPARPPRRPATATASASDLRPATVLAFMVVSAVVSWFLWPAEESGHRVADTDGATLPPQATEAGSLAPIVGRAWGIAEPITASTSSAIDLPVAAVPVPETRPAAPGAEAPAIGFAVSHRLVVSESERFILMKVRASGRLRDTVRLSVKAVPGAAQVNEDFVPPLPEITLTPARPTADVLVSLLGDSKAENVEDFSVVLAVEEGKAKLARKSVVVVLTDDD